MQVRPYSEIDVSKVVGRRLDPLENIYRPILIDKYNVSEDALAYLGIPLLTILKISAITPSESIEQTKVLDLGCGNNSGIGNVVKPLGDRMYEPWLCRLLYELGAEPIGVDMGNLDNEEFEHYSVDLTRENSLEMIPDNSVDVANARMLFDSPSFISRRSGQDQDRLRGNIIKQLDRIVKQGGFFIYDSI